jgi:hypothetical protein
VRELTIGLVDKLIRKVDHKHTDDLIEETIKLCVYELTDAIGKNI